MMMMEQWQASHNQLVKKPLPADKLEEAIKIIVEGKKTKQFFFDNYDLTEEQVIEISKY
jgi:hypothetical protein